MPELFGPVISKLDLTVRNDYDHCNCLERFKRREKIRVNHPFDYFLEDEFYGEDIKGDMLIPGETYQLEIFPVLEDAKTDICMDFLRDQGSLNVGFQGLLTAKKIIEKNTILTGNIITSVAPDDMYTTTIDGLKYIPYLFPTGNKVEASLDFSFMIFGWSLLPGDYLISFKMKS